MSRKTIQPHTVFTDHRLAVEKVAWSFDSQYLATYGNDGAVRVWEASTGTTHFIYAARDHANAPLRGLAWSPREHLLAIGCEDSGVLVCDPLRGDTLSAYRGHDGPVSSLAWSPDGKILASASRAEFHLWRASSG